MARGEAIKVKCHFKTTPRISAIRMMISCTVSANHDCDYDFCNRKKILTVQI